MSYTSNIYKVLYDEILTDVNNTKSRLSRRIKMKNDIILIFSVNKETLLCELFLSVGNISLKNSFPHWKGVEIGTAKFSEYDDSGNYIIFRQSASGERYIFEIIAEDLRLSLEKLDSKDKLIKCFQIILEKWKDFFLSDNNLCLSPEREIGLFGELLFLKQLINIFGNAAISFWAGCNNETHDFYIRGNAVEVKTVVHKSPYKVTINSEYQLDTKDVTKKLYLKFFALRKSESDGATLPQLIEEIISVLSLSSDYGYQCQFIKKIEKYGYLTACKELYNTKYFVRNDSLFWVNDNFPKIVKSEIESGLSNVTYLLSIDICQKYLVSDGAEEFRKEVILNDSRDI